MTDVPSQPAAKPTALQTLTQQAQADIVILSVDDTKDNILDTQLRNTEIPVFIKLNDYQIPERLIRDNYDKIHGFALTVKRATDVNRYDVIINRLESVLNLSPRYFAFIPMVTSSDDVINWAPIAVSCERNVALLLAEDHCNGIFPTVQSRDHYLYELVLAAKMAELAVICAPDRNVSSHGLYRKRNLQLKEMGFEGRVTLTVDQSVLCRDTFSVSKSQLDVFSNVRKAQSLGIGVRRRSEQESRHMVAPPHRRAADLLQEKIDGGYINTPPSTTNSRPVQIHPQITNTHNKLGELIQSDMMMKMDISTMVWKQSFNEDLPLVNSDVQARRHGFTERMVPFSLLSSLVASLSGYKYVLNSSTTALYP